MGGLERCFYIPWAGYGVNMAEVLGRGLSVLLSGMLCPSLFYSALCKYVIVGSRADESSRSFADL